MKKHACVALFCLLSALYADEPWNLHPIDQSSQGADGVRLMDVNQDGLQDIAVGWEEGGIVRAYLHPGGDQAKAPWPAVTTGKVKSPEDAVFMDVDADGAVDVVSSCEGSNKSIYVHWAPKVPEQYLEPDRWSTEAFPATHQQQAWMYALPKDIDGKNGRDLIVASKGKNGSVGWLESPENPRDLAAWRWHKLQDAGWIMSLISEDMDGDGDDDVLISDRKGGKRGIYWLKFPEWTRQDIGGANREILFISRGDVDQDGKLDVLGIGRKHIVWFRNTGGNWQEHLVPLPAGVGTGKSVVTFDVNADGKNDLLFSCENAKGDLSGMRWLSWTDSPLNPEWTSHEIGGPLGLKYDRVVLYDVDGDGDDDVLCCEERDQLGVFWYENPFGR